ncbi:hypothetical protein KDA_75040 [Dictyobacter alpinus]|uniref:Uncharacterized protein n=2 Tax=Dictyobacter alpinus TaxID=2014873 RepID=A0A402BL28_9CHLR|nr:hypothetical protein KDA_75040 [Dictyobacter alpinus]
MNDSTLNTSLVPLDVDFDDEIDAVVKPTLQPNPQLMYMTGNLTTTTFETAVGWHVPADVNPTLDELLASRGTKRYTVQHKTGEVRQKPYWNLNWNGAVCSLIPVAYGIKSTWEMGRKIDDRVGIAYGVGIATERDGTVQISKKTGLPKKKPQLQMRVFIHELLDKENGFNEWFQVSLSNYLVDDMLAALNEQFRVLDAYNAAIRAQVAADPKKWEEKKPPRAPYWGFSIPMVPGTPKPVGPKDGDQSTIFPMVAKIPELPLNVPATIAYLNAHRTPEHIREVLREGLLDETLIWSVQRSQEIVEERPEVTVTEEHESIDGTAVELPQLPSGDDPLVNATQMAWIRDTYCSGSQDTIKAICQHFRVADLVQLRVSQYTLLYNQLTQK